MRRSIGWKHRACSINKQTLQFSDNIIHIYIYINAYRAYQFWAFEICIILCDRIPTAVLFVCQLIDDISFSYLGALQAATSCRICLSLDQRRRCTGVVTDAVPTLRLRFRCCPFCMMVVRAGGNGGFVRPKFNIVSELPSPLSSSNAINGVVELVGKDNLRSVLLFGVVVVSVPSAVDEYVSSHDRSSERPLRSDLRSLSTSRVWNLLKLLWLPLVGFGGLALVGLVNELSDVRDDVRENGRELVRLIGIDWLRWTGDGT